MKTVAWRRREVKLATLTAFRVKRVTNLEYWLTSMNSDRQADYINNLARSTLRRADAANQDICIDNNAHGEH